jgi:predicted PurR-regulated permease PerM
MVNIAFCLIIAIYIMLDGRRIMTGTLGLIPRHYRGEVQAIMQSINENFGGFIRGQLILAVIYAIGVAVVMVIAGLDYKVTCAIFAGFAMLIPFVGPFISIVPPLLVAVFTNPDRIWWVILLLIIMQQVVLNGIGPRVFGRTINMHPLVVIAAALAGAATAGVWGAIFGIPVAGILASIVKRLYVLQQQRDASQPAALEAPPIVVEAGTPSSPTRGGD